MPSDNPLKKIQGELIAAAAASLGLNQDAKFIRWNKAVSRATSDFTTRTAHVRQAEAKNY